MLLYKNFRLFLGYYTESFRTNLICKEWGLKYDEILEYIKRCNVRIKC